MPSAVDSAAIAGMVDVLHTQGCFALSIRYAICLGLSTSRIGDDVDLPAHLEYAHSLSFLRSHWISMSKEQVTTMTL